MDDDVADRLKQWADDMGYVHWNLFHLGYSADYNKLCKHKTRLVWENTTRKVKPLLQLEHIRKNILLSRIGIGTHLLQGFDLSGSLGQEVKQSQELKKLQEQKQALIDRIGAEEASIRDIQRDFKKKYSHKRFQQNQLKETRVKAEMLRIKKADSESFKSWLDDTHNTVKSLCPSIAEISGQPGKDIASPALEKCIKLVSEYHAWCKESVSLDNIEEENDLQSEQDKRKVALWKAVTSIIGKIPAEQIWNSMLCDFMQRSVSGMESLASSVDMSSKLDTQRESNADNVKPEQNLSAVYLKSMAMTADHLVKAKTSSCQLDQILKQKATEIQENFPADLNLSKNSQPSRERIFDLLRFRCRLVELGAAKKALTDSVAEMKLETRDLSSCAQRLKEERAAVTRLDNHIAEVKAEVEQGLLAISGIGSKLKKAQQGVFDELDSFAQKCTAATDVVSTWSSAHDDTVSSTCTGPHRNGWACSTPAIHKGKGPDLFHLNDTGLTINNHSIDKSVNKASFREVASTLKNAVASESKSFFKLPLDLVPRLKLPASMEDISGLVTESPALIALLSCPGDGLKQLKQLKLLSPCSMATDGPSLMLHVFQQLGHRRAARLQQLSSARPQPPVLCAAVSQQYYSVTAPEQYASIREQLKDVVTMVENAQEDVSEGRDTFNDWVRMPVQSMIPSSLLVEGKPFKEWKRKYDALVGLLRG